MIAISCSCQTRKIGLTQAASETQTGIVYAEHPNLLKHAHGLLHIPSVAERKTDSRHGCQTAVSKPESTDTGQSELLTLQVEVQGDSRCLGMGTADTGTSGTGAGGTGTSGTGSGTGWGSCWSGTEVQWYRQLGAVQRYKLQRYRGPEEVQRYNGHINKPCDSCTPTQSAQCRPRIQLCTPMFFARTHSAEGNAGQIHTLRTFYMQQSFPMLLRQ